MTLQLLHSEVPYKWGKFDFLFYQCGRLYKQRKLTPHINVYKVRLKQRIIPSNPSSPMPPLVSWLVTFLLGTKNTGLPRDRYTESAGLVLCQYTAVLPSLEDEGIFQRVLGVLEFYNENSEMWSKNHHCHCRYRAKLLNRQVWKYTWFMSFEIWQYNTLAYYPVS